MFSFFILPFAVSLIMSVFFTPIIRFFALRFDVIDRPETDPTRKIHKTPIPLLGGMAIFLSFSTTLLFFTLFTERILGGYFLKKYVIALLLSGLILMIGGIIDDRKNLKAKFQLFFPFFAALVVIMGGVGISFITNPLGGTIRLDQWNFTLFTLGGFPYKITLLADLFTLVWMMGMMYTTKLLDGLDGLVSGIGTIGSIIIFILSLRPDVFQPETATVAAIFAGACCGFLFFNFHPARIYLGEGGSLFIGFVLGFLSIVSGGKIATALLIMGIPILDVLWVIIRRLWQGKSPFRAADKKHFHHRLLEAGMTHRQAVLVFYFFTAIFGYSAAFLHGKQKLLAMLILVMVMALLGTLLIHKAKKAVGTGVDKKEKNT